MICALKDCGEKAGEFTLCETHRAKYGSVPRRARRARPRPVTLPPTPDRPPLPHSEHHHVPLTAGHIAAVRDAYRTRTFRDLAEEMGLSTQPVRRIVNAVPGDPIYRYTRDRVEEWMQGVRS